MSINVLLVYPEIPATYWSFKYILKVLGKKAAFPPLGIMTVAAMLPEGYEPRVVDLNAATLRDKDILWADIVFTSSMIVQKESLDEVVRRCTALGKPVVAGGPYPTSSHEQISGVDYFVLDEAEMTLLQFLHDYEKGTPRKVYRSDVKPDISTTPVPRFDLIDINSYTTMSLQYSRGCPFNCEFCDIIEMFGRVPRTKGVAQFIAEFDALYRSGYRGPLFVVDDNFIGNKREVKKLLPEITRWQEDRRYPFMLFTEASVNLADDEELMDMMVAAGFNKVFLGVETPVEESLKKSQKKQNIKIALQDSIERIQRKGMEVTAGFILGFDSDPPDIFDLQIDFIQESGIPLAMVGLLTALPQTQLYRRLKSEGRMLNEASGNNTHNFQMNFIPVMDRDTLVQGYKRVISHIYRPEAYFDRCMTMLRRMPQARKYRGAVTFSTVMMVIRIALFSLIRQSFSSYGIRYIRYLAKSLREGDGLFPKAVKMAFIGHHFFKITREIVAVDEFSMTLESLRLRLRGRMEGINLGRLDDILRDIKSMDRGIIISLQRKYRALHVDFRDHIEEPMKRLAEEFRLYLEKIAQSLNERVENSFGNVAAAREELKYYREKIKYKIRRQYRYLHRDLKKYIDNGLEYFDGLMRANTKKLDEPTSSPGNRHYSS